MNPEGSVLASPLLSASWKAAEVAFSWVLLPLLPFFLESFDFFFSLRHPLWDLQHQIPLPRAHEETPDPGQPSRDLEVLTGPWWTWQRVPCMGLLNRRRAVSGDIFFSEQNIHSRWICHLKT